MTKDEFSNKISDEMANYKRFMLSKSVEYVYDAAYRIMVMGTFYDYFMEGDELGNFSEADLTFLYDNTQGNVLHILADEYFDSEGYDIASNEDVRHLIENYIDWRKPA